MTDKTTLLALIEKLEKAETGSRELDGRIYCAINDLVFRSVSQRGFHFEPDAAGTHTHVTPTPYSTSVDEALKLVPEGWVINMAQRDPNAIHQPLWWVRLDNFGDSELDDQVVRHNSLAIALVCAALKARL